MFPKINRAYNGVFKPKRLSVGLVVPIESYSNSAVPTMDNHIERVQLAEARKLSYSMDDSGSPSDLNWS